VLISTELLPALRPPIAMTGDVTGLYFSRTKLLFPASLV